jgi:hypothetical protein
MGRPVRMAVTTSPTTSTLVTFSPNPIRLSVPGGAPHRDDQTSIKPSWLFQVSAADSYDEGTHGWDRRGLCRSACVSGVGGVGLVDLGSMKIIDIRRCAAGTPIALAARTVQLGCDGEDLGMLSELAQSRPGDDTGHEPRHRGWRSLSELDSLDPRRGE